MKEIDMKDVFDSNQIESLLLGANGLSLVNIHSDMPTDPNLVAQHIIRFIRETDSGSEKWKDVEKGLLKLAESGEGTWLFSYYLLVFAVHSKSYADGFECLDISSLVIQLQKAVKRFRSSLKLNKSWTGVNYEDGLYGDVIRLINIMNEEFGMGIVV